MSYDELTACRRKHLNTHYIGKRGKGDAFDHAKGNVNAADVLIDWRVERIVLLGKNVARCFGFRDLPFLAEIRIYGRRFLIFPHPSGVNPVVERTTKRTTRSTTSAAVPTGRNGSRWIPKEWTVAEFAPAHKLTAFWALKEVFFFAIAELIKVSRTHFLRASIGHHGRIHFAIRQSKPVDVGAVSRLWIAMGEQSGLLTRIATVNASLCERMKS